MLRRPTRTETLLRELAGAGLLGATAFTFRVILGILALPVQGIAWVVLGLYYALLRLHLNGEQSIIAVNRFIESGRRDYD